MMKKHLFAAAAALMLCLLAGCGEKPEPDTPVTDATAPQIQEETETRPIVDPEGNTLAEKPTEREHDIVETADFEFEIINGGAVVTKYTGTAADVVIPDTLGGAPVTELGYYAFEAKWDLKSVVIPDTVTAIGEFCFSDCSSLESVNIPENVTVLDRGAFAVCSSLTEIYLPAGVRYVHEEAFTACNSLTSLTVCSDQIQYENWGLEELPELTVYAPEGSPVLQWAQNSGINCAAV